MIGDRDKLGGPPGCEQGEITISFTGDGPQGRVRVIEKIVIEKPTNDKVLKALERLRTSGFRGNVYLQALLSDPYVITTEKFKPLDRKLLDEILGKT